MLFCDNIYVLHILPVQSCGRLLLYKLATEHGVSKQSNGKLSRRKNYVRKKLQGATVLKL